MVFVWDDAVLLSGSCDILKAREPLNNSMITLAFGRASAPLLPRCRACQGLRPLPPHDALQPRAQSPAEWS